ncbi:MAG: acyl-CoA dehydratase activase-related protein [Candidatus Metalachnospira sp.]|nr:acyl-CoA dehydratase activase-related protein [Candidatus Metalachnospira sp.]
MRKSKEAAPMPKSVTIGLPRAMLYHRYEVLWKNYFSTLGISCVISEPTNKEIIKIGTAVAIDEACLCTKIYLGHVKSLIGKCDYILVPRISNFGIKRNMCTKFESLYDIVCNTFRKSNQKFISYNVDVINGHTEEKAFTELGVELGFTKKVALAAFKAAKKSEIDSLKNKIKSDEALYKKSGLKILIVAHSYIEKDPYIGKPVTDYLKKIGAVPIYADEVDRKDALKQCERVSPTLKWELSKELVGSIQIHADKIDGIVLMSAFPCGPDSMVDEMIIRKFNGIPILNLILDDQDGTAGLETRLESFIDILNFKGGRL